MFYEECTLPLGDFDALSERLFFFAEAFFRFQARPARFRRGLHFLLLL